MPQRAIAIVIGIASALASAAPNATNADLSGLPGGLVSWQNLAALSLSGAGQQPSCFNPLFKTHWAGKSDIRHLSPRPQIQRGLRLCPGYNSRSGCCMNSFEHVLSVAFQRWVKHFQRKAQTMKDFQVQMAKVKVSQSYVKADKLQRALFDKAMTSFSRVLKWHGTCFDTLLEYLAGILCFACDPAWGRKVFFGQGGRSVDHLHVDDFSNEALWQGCRSLGDAAAEMQTRVADSLLTKGIQLHFEDLSMFSSKVSVAHYMARLGLYPLRGSSENHLVLSPGGGNAAGQDRQLAASVGGPDAFVDPVRSGRTSGFQCAVFPRIPFGLSGTRGLTALVPLLAMFASALRPVR